MPQELTWTVQDSLEQDPAWYVSGTGRLDVDKLVAAFQGFFREHWEHRVARFDYGKPVRSFFCRRSCSG